MIVVISLQRGFLGCAPNNAEGYRMYERYLRQMPQGTQLNRYLSNTTDL